MQNNSKIAQWAGTPLFGWFRHVNLGLTNQTVPCQVLVRRDDLFITASWDETIRMWSATSGTCLLTLRGHTEGTQGELEVMLLKQCEEQLQYARDCAIFLNICLY